MKRRAPHGVAGDFEVPQTGGPEDSATEAQRERILQALRQRPQSSEDIRRLGVMQPAARVKELRDRFGHHIETTRITMVDRDSWPHAGVALYSLVEQKGGRDA